jgi:2'-5' RNA ligase
MAFIGLKISHETARLLGEIEVSGKRESSDELHITMLFLGQNVPVETLAQALVATYAITRQTPPFTVRTSLVTSFPKNDQGLVPIICRVESEPLRVLQGKVKDAFKSSGIHFSDRHPTYLPHVTLAYDDKPAVDREIPTVEWGAHELVLWGGDEGDRRLTVTFPFTLVGSEKIAQRVAQRFAVLRGS